MRTLFNKLAIVKGVLVGTVAGLLAALVTYIGASLAVSMGCLVAMINGWATPFVIGSVMFFLCLVVGLIWGIEQMEIEEVEEN